MVKWLRERAPIKRKLTVTFCLTTALLGLALALAWWSTLLLAGHVASSEGAAAVHNAFLGLEIGSALLPALAIGIGIGLTRLIATPYVTTVVRMEGLAAGDLDSPIRFTDYSDCVGRLTKAMFTFRDNAVAKISADAEALAQRGRAEQERRAGETAAIADQQRMVVGSIGAGLERLAAGDLTFVLNDPLPDAYEVLRQNFNLAVEKLNEVISIISSNTKTMLSGTSEISSAADDLSRRTEQQAASLEETAAALDEITATVRKTAEGAEKARGVVSTAKADAEHSGKVVREAVTAMSAIETSARQISQIIGVIDEIAFQTNLLALNAGVEAARAGDAGRGFAVVASEVRALAQRSAESAREIKSLISTSSQQVDRGVELVAETGRSLERIVSQVGQIDGVVTEIAASAHEQASGLAEVNTAINQMDQVTQQNAAMVEQSTAASHSLAAEATELGRLTSRFTVCSNIVEQAATVLPLRRPGSKSARNGEGPPKDVRQVRQGALARKLSPVADEEGWTEF